MANEIPLLDLTTISDRFHVRIDGAPHFLAHPDALTLSQTMRLDAIRPRIIMLLREFGDGNLQGTHEGELSELLGQGCRIVLDAPDVVQVRLSDAQRLSILQAFFKLRSSSGQTTGADAKATPPNGAKPSRGSKGSTAALRKAG